MLDFDGANFRDWMASVGLLRVISETTDMTTICWHLERGRYSAVLENAPEDIALRCWKWTQDHKSRWHLGGYNNVSFGPEVWREAARKASGVETALWCALGADVVLHRDRKKIQASALEYGHGGGHQHWLGSLRHFLTSEELTVDAIARVLRGERHDSGAVICRWDAACERPHAYLESDPAASRNKMHQDAVINALAGIGLASCPSMPAHGKLVTPLVYEKNVIRWPLWTDALRIDDLEMALLTTWSWPTMEGRRWISDKLYCFAKGSLCEPQAMAR